MIERAAMKAPIPLVNPVMGTQVNLAARLVNVAKPGQIMITQRTYELVRDLIDVVEVGPLTVKGFQKPVVAFNVVGVKGGPRLDQAA